jgi:two-component system, OmpR family, sensor histidine kinase ArlS
MPVRLRITFLFSLLAFIILSGVCISIYYFSYQQRLINIKSRLTNRGITTARLLSQEEYFDERLINLIDSSTTISLKRKTVQAYDFLNRKIYEYSDAPNDTLHIDKKILDEARMKGSYYFVTGNKEAIAYYYTHNNTRIVIVSAAEDADAKENLKNLLKILILSFLVGNIFILASGYIFSGRLLRPIKKISEDVTEISAQNLARRIQTGQTKDEWYQLSHTLNDLLNRLQESFELQRRFISNASHELSTPLTSISSQLEITLQRQRESEEYRKVMQSVYQDVRHMTKLTQTLLEFAKASGNPGGLEIDVIRIDEILLRLPAEVTKSNRAFSVQIEFDELPEDEEKLLVFGNEALLLTAIKNIVVNACKYSFDNRAIVNLQVKEASLFVSVKNKGKGIPAEELENIFQPFYRMEENRTTGGFGLGLSLTMRIIKIHKGSIQVSSEPGQETVFTIQLPAAHSLHSSKL